MCVGCTVLCTRRVLIRYCDAVTNDRQTGRQAKSSISVVAINGIYLVLLLSMIMLERCLSKLLTQSHSFVRPFCKLNHVCCVSVSMYSPFIHSLDEFRCICGCVLVLSTHVLMAFCRLCVSLSQS